MGMVAPDDFRVQPESQRVATAYVVLAQMLGKPGCVLERMTATWLQRASNRMAGGVGSGRSMPLEGDQGLIQRFADIKKDALRRLLYRVGGPG